MAPSNIEIGHRLHMPDASIAGYVTATVIVAYILYVGIYNRYFHPLAKFPGPLLGSMTDWYLVYIICSVPTFGLELHKKYGILRSLESFGTSN